MLPTNTNDRGNNKMEEEDDNSFNNSTSNSNNDNDITDITTIDIDIKLYEVGDTDAGLGLIDNRNEDNWSSDDDSYNKDGTYNDE